MKPRTCVRGEVSDLVFYCGVYLPSFCIGLLQLNLNERHWGISAIDDVMLHPFIPAVD